MRVLHINCNYAGSALHKRMIEHLNDCMLKGGDRIESCVYVPVFRITGADVETKGAQVILSPCFKKWDRIVFDYKQGKIFRDINQKYDVSTFDCIHAYTVFTDGNCARRLGRRYNIPYVVAVRNTDVNTFFAKAFYLRKRGLKIIQEAEAVFFLSEAYYKTVMDKYIPKKLKKEIEKKSYIVPNGIDDFWHENLYTDKCGRVGETKESLRNRSLKVIYAGNINKDKNITATEKALEILREKGWKVTFTVVGRIAEKSAYNEMISYPGTVYVESQPKEKLIQYYRDNDIFVMPSHTETFGLVYAEAMSQGLPVLYTKGQGFDGQFEEGLVGYSVNDRDPFDIADKIIAVTENYEAMCDNCLSAVQRFRWAEICKVYAGIYSDLSLKD